MPILTLVRHAKSSWDYPELSDFERPLNGRGRKDAPAMAARLRKAGIKPDQLVSSPATRAVTTARLFAKELNLSFDDTQLNPHIYEASAWTLLHIVRGFPDLDEDVMMFGHNPGISDFARQLADCPFDEMPTCGVVRIALEVKGWAQVREGCGKVLRYDYPRKKTTN